MNAEKIVSKLTKKARHLKWKNDDRQENYLVFSKSFSERTEKAKCFDLDDLRPLCG